MKYSHRFKWRSIWLEISGKKGYKKPYAPGPKAICHGCGYQGNIVGQTSIFWGGIGRFHFSLLKKYKTCLFCLAFGPRSENKQLNEENDKEVDGIPDISIGP